MDEFFDTLLQGEEKAAWDGFKFVVKIKSILADIA